MKKALSTQLRDLFLHLLLITSFSHFTYAADEALKIAIITDLSGPASYWGSQTVRGALLAKEEFSKQGKPIEILFEDHGLQAKNAVTAAHKVLNVDKVDAVYSEFTVTTLPISPVVKKSEKLFVGVCGASSFLKSNQYALKSYLNYVDGCETIAREWLSLGIKSVGMLKAEAEYAVLCEVGLRKVYPKLNVFAYTSGADVRTEVAKFKAGGVEAIVNVGFERDLLSMHRAQKTIKYFPRIGSNFDAVTDKVLELASENRSTFMSFGYARVSADFISKLQSFDGKSNLSSIEGAALAYLHIQQIVLAVEQCGLADESCQTKTIRGLKGSDSSILGFKGYTEGAANFEIGLTRY